MQELDRVIGRMTLLIAILILVAYYQGATSILQTLGNTVGGLVSTLQGKGGTFAGYAK